MDREDDYLLQVARNACPKFGRIWIQRAVLSDDDTLGARCTRCQSTALVYISEGTSFEDAAKMASEMGCSCVSEEPSREVTILGPFLEASSRQRAKDVVRVMHDARVAINIAAELRRAYDAEVAQRALPKPERKPGEGQVPAERFGPRDRTR